jgi:hypothetical protein
VTTPSRTDTAPTEAVRANGLAKWWVRTPCSHAKRPSVSRATTRSGLASTTWGWTMTCRLEDGGEVLTRPHTFPSHVFGIDGAFAFEWWILLAFPAMGL